MKKLIIAIFLISLVANKEILEINSNIREIKGKVQKNNLRKLMAAGFGTVVFKEVGKFLLSYVLSKLVDAMVDKFKESRSVLNASFKPSHFTQLYKDGGDGLFISYIENDYVVSMYYHKTKMHTATCDGGILGGGTISALGSPGEWAIAFCKAGISRRRTYYNHF